MRTPTRPFASTKSQGVDDPVSAIANNDRLSPCSSANTAACQGVDEPMVKLEGVDDDVLSQSAAVSVPFLTCVVVMSPVESEAAGG